jgi:hypothetical protein
MTPATFYTVNGPRGVYYAVRNHHTGMVWTERTESAAHQQAQEEGLALIASETVNHHQLLDLMIPQAPVRPLAVTINPDPPRPTPRVRSGLTSFLQRFRRDPAKTPENSK